MAARVTLVNSVVASTASYYMQAMKMSVSTLNELDRISRNFIWGSTNERRKLHYVNWETVTNSKENGGLGIKAAKHLNEAFMAKLSWEVIHNDAALWVQVLRNKYLMHNRSPSNQSGLWKGMGISSHILNKGIKWVVRDGSRVSFWLDNWSDLGILRELISGPFTINDAQLMVKDLITEDGIWDFSHLSFSLPESICQVLRAVPLQLYSRGEDCIVWKGDSSGKFTTKSAYQIAKTNSTIDVPWRWIWKAPTYPKIQCFLWQMAHQKLATNSFLNCIGLQPLSTCPICNSQPETVEHLFRLCPAAVALWNQLQTPLSPSQMSFFDWLRTNCANRDPSHFMNIPWNIIFCFTVWFHWNARNLKVFGSDKPFKDPILSIVERAAEYFALYCNEPQTICGPVNLFVDRETNVSRPFVEELNAPRDV
ncbi:hypothetical protein COLO4_01156 [Corchorus olitorius]|uniref:Reverse transcriptase zinc-binding domain-containing protein n=1 Tax=Corchorus olitorius TaxID=93759 RepID=A0A1R3L2W3_9ROSI|nr:hypothetical protein COLO4_01156 [Corchorus olitorius]